MALAEVMVSGFADERFAEVRAIFEDNLASGRDTGACVAITLEGEPVVDLWGGWADAARTRPWERDTIVNVFSVTKTMTALCALILADRGQLDFAAPVARYWPEFAAAGKERVTVAQLMSHSAGLSGWRAPMAVADLYDWDKATSLLAAQEPWWEPGTASGYHGTTQGYLVGEVVRRIDGRSLGTFFREEIAEPLGADFQIGFGPEHDQRVAQLIPPAGAATANWAPSELQINMATNPQMDVLEALTRDWRAAEIPAAGGHGNARSIAQVHAILANGGVAQGKRFLSEAGCRKALEHQISGTDLVLGMPVTLGIGFGLAEMLDQPSPNSMFWSGYGGSLSLIDMDARTSFAFTMNQMGATTFGDERSRAMARAMWRALGLRD
jgi:CubicO group peptidase (beta-lactamase class C family)